MIDLSGIWSLKDAENAYKLPMAIPGDAISALHTAEQIPDPYYGRNEYDLRWIADRDWTISRDFDTTDVAQDLVVEGLDTIADIAINGVQILSAQNSFRRYRVDASDALKPGKNTITITFHSNTTAANELQAGQPWPVPSHIGNCPIPNGNMLRKVQCDFGWDWNLALAPFGLYGTIALEPQVALRIADIIVNQTHTHGRATLTITVETEASHAGSTPITATICGKSANGIHAFNAGSNQQTLTLEIDDPDLWWPAGRGAQTLHTLEIRLDDATITRRIGLRDITLDTSDGFCFIVNGERVYAMGANWIPADALAGNITPEKTRDLLQSAVDANMNMLRIWGGGRYEDSWFYDLCDEMGLMIWQDFMFSCNLYPADDAYLAEVRAEVHDQTRRLNHHACLALWCGDNELIGALGWYDESRENRDRYLVSYDRLNRTIETALKDIIPDTNWWPSSPSPGPMSFGDAWHDDSAGDMHFWSVWHEGRDFDHYRDINPRFCSEFGFQSYPSMDVIKRFAAPEDMNIASPVMESHQKNKGGNARIAETMFRYFRFPNAFEDFVYVSQIQQGLAIKTAVDYWRSIKPHCMGALYWQLNDTWPVCSWASLDHGGGWKLMHHMARDFFAPITVSAIPELGGFTLRGVNDTGTPVMVGLRVFAAAMDGNLRELAASKMEIRNDAAINMTSVSKHALEPDEILYWTWESGEISGEDHLSPVPYKSLDLAQTDLSLDLSRDGDAWLITVKTTALAFFTSLESDQPGRFSNNAYLLFPDTPVMVRFDPVDPDVTPNFTVRDLRAATY